MPFRSKALLTGVVVALGTGVPVAQAAYGPESPPPVLAPGGYTQVITSRVVERHGSVIRTAIRHMRLTIDVPRGEFKSPVQIVVLKPHLDLLAAAVRRGRLHRDKVIGGFGVGASTLSGAAVDRFRRPLRIVLGVGKLARRAVVVRYDQSKRTWVRVEFTRGKDDTLVVLTRTPGAFAIVVPPPSHSRRQRHPSVRSSHRS